MTIPQIHLLVSMAVLAVTAVLVLVVGKRGKRLTPLAGPAFAFVPAGILFGDNKLTGNGLMGAGVTVALVDLFSKSKAK